MSSLLPEKFLTLPSELQQVIFDNIPDEYLIQYIDIPAIGELALDVLASNVIIFKETPKLIRELIIGKQPWKYIEPMSDGPFKVSPLKAKHKIRFDITGFLRFIKKYPEFRPQKLYVDELAGLEAIQRKCKWVIDHSTFVSVARRNNSYKRKIFRALSKCNDNVSYHINTNRCDDFDIGPYDPIPSKLVGLTYGRLALLNPDLEPFSAYELGPFPETLTYLDMYMERTKSFNPDLPISLKHMTIEFESMSEAEEEEGLSSPMQIDIGHAINLQTVCFKGINSLDFRRFKAPQGLRNLAIHSCLLHGNWMSLSKFTKMKYLHIRTEGIESNLVADFPTSLKLLSVWTVPPIKAEVFDIPPNLELLDLRFVTLPVPPAKIQFPNTLKDLFIADFDRTYVWHNIKLPQVEKVTLCTNAVPTLEFLPKSIREFTFHLTSCLLLFNVNLSEYSNMTSLSLIKSEIVSFNFKLPPNLEILNLRENSLEEIQLDCPKLRVLDISHNKFTSLNKSNLKLPKGLKELYLGDHQLVNRGQKTSSRKELHSPLFENCFPESLEVLCMQTSNINCTILKNLKLSKCPNLKVLRLQTNPITSLNSALFPKSLVYLDLSMNEIDRIVNGNFSRFKSLRGMNVSFNDFSDSWMDRSIIFPSSLEYLNMTSCFLTNLHIQNLIIDDCKNLQWVFLAGNKFIADLNDFLSAIKKFCPLISSVHVDESNYKAFKSSWFNFLDLTYDEIEYRVMCKMDESFFEEYFSNFM
ncbi:uncharacterized protein J8A68_004003 [[Candida] subhashii]|uniref:Uncharacterized protein n=1 Tax=[Candida] subhashii TaxID=561895 RepID=A0A8J5QG93_9ASCO|nr:uncharacterized protein J8A68_004003 [[Candida] subhashii]KAG7662472.1 hypothetical protein J8A68_004003 [[Candida] subhashii]